MDFPRIDELPKKNVKPFLNEVKKFIETLEPYFEKTEDYMKSTIHFQMADLYFHAAREQGEYIPFDKSHKLAFAAIVVNRVVPFTENLNIPFVDGTQEFADLLKIADISYKYGAASSDLIKEDMKHWNNLVYRNVDFKAVEASIENKEILTYFKPKNCLFDRCNFQDLEYIKVSAKNNELFKCKVGKTKNASKNKIAKVSLKPKRKVVKKDKKLTNDELSL